MVPFNKGVAIKAQQVFPPHRKRNQIRTMSAAAEAEVEAACASM
jgi:hypothetical protein